MVGRCGNNFHSWSPSCRGQWRTHQGEWQRYDQQNPGWYNADPSWNLFGNMGTGVLTTLLFCLPPLLDIRRIKPSLVLRRMVEPPSMMTMQERWQQRRAQWISTAVILLALAGIAAGLTSSLLIATWFTVALVTLLLFITLLSRGTLRGLRAGLTRTRLSLPSSLRHGLSNLYRPGNQSTQFPIERLGADSISIGLPGHAAWRSPHRWPVQQVRRG